MTKFVVDANVGIKWVLSEVHSEAALRLLDDDYELLVPDFFFPEIGNILWKRIRRHEISLKQAQNDLTVLIDGDLQVCPSKPLMQDALEMAARVDQAVYDCVYLSLAVTHKCQMVTADKRFYNALSHNALSSNLMWVEEIP